MKALEILFSSFLLFFFLRPAGAFQNHCSPNGLEVHFPFYINGSSSGRCGFSQGFGLTCKNSQPVLKLPSAGDFIVQSIKYNIQEIRIKDPGNCIPKRLLNFSLSDSPFQEAPRRQRNLRLLSCNMDNSTEFSEEFELWSNDCVNETNHTIVALDESRSTEASFSYYLHSQCKEIKTVLVSVSRFGSLELKWDEPNCGACEQEGITCGFKRGTDSEIESSKSSSHGLPRSAKYGLIIGIGIPGLLCLIGISCCICGRIRTYARRRHRSDTDFAISIGPLPAVVMMGLDGPTIESYPKTVLGESMRLPKPSDGTCPICLSEYQPKDTIRTIPECNHCFHVDCVDEWLKMNPTCPVCRNSPDASSLGTPCSSVSSSAILSSSPSSTSLS